jgi:hypothetical protein
VLELCKSEAKRHEDGLGKRMEELHNEEPMDSVLHQIPLLPVQHQYYSVLFAQILDAIYCKEEFEFLSSMVRKRILWDITPCSPLKVNRRFGGTYSLDLQSRISRVRYKRMAAP